MVFEYCMHGHYYSVHDSRGSTCCHHCSVCEGQVWSSKNLWLTSLEYVLRLKTGMLKNEVKQNRNRQSYWILKFHFCFIRITSINWTPWSKTKCRQYPTGVETKIIQLFCGKYLSINLSFLLSIIFSHISLWATKCGIAVHPQ